MLGKLQKLAILLGLQKSNLHLNFSFLHLISHFFQIHHTHHGYELGELELEVDGDCLCGVDHGPDQLVVVAQQVIIQPLGVMNAPIHRVQVAQNPHQH